MSDTPPILVEFGDYAGPIVGNTYTQAIAFAHDAFDDAKKAISNLATYTVTPLTFNATFNPQIALGAFPTLPKPIFPTADMRFNPPAAPSSPPVVELGDYQPSTPPTFDVVAPTLVMPATPNVVAPTPPGKPPTISTPAIPVAPDYVLPDVPTMRALNLPDAPSITFPTFDSPRPDFDAPIPDETFSFQPQDYVSNLLDQTRSVIAQMLDGGIALSPAVASAIRNRAYAEADNEILRATAEVYDDSAARGFSEPSGQEHARILEARTRAMKQRSAINRDVFIQEQTIAIENVKFAISSGIQLEGQLMSLHTSMMQLQLESAKFALDSAIAILNARISVFNAQMQGRAIDAQVFRDLIQEALAQLEVYRSQLQAQQLIGQLNEQDLRLYNAQLDGVRTLADLYKSQLEAVDIEARNNVTILQGFSEQVRAFAAQIDGNNAQWNGYRTQVDAQLGNAQYYGTLVGAFNSRMNAYNLGEQAKIEANRLMLQRGEMSLDTWKATLAMYEASLRAEVERLAAVAQGFTSQTELYTADAQVATAAAEYDNRRFQLNLAQEQAIVDTDLKRADFDLEQLKFIGTLQTEIRRAIAQVSAQLAAAALSSFNMNASVSSSHSNSMGYSLSLNYSGSMDDTTTTP